MVGVLWLRSIVVLPAITPFELKAGEIDATGGVGWSLGEKASRKWDVNPASFVLWMSSKLSW